jgi:hypothetical protein
LAPLCYRRHRFPPEIIQHAIWLYLRFTLSYRDVEELPPPQPDPHDDPQPPPELADFFVGDVELLRELGRFAPQPLTVIIERDGRYPPIARLLG